MSLRITSALFAAGLLAACGSSPDTTMVTSSTTETYTQIELHYTPELEAACGELDLRRPHFAFDSANLGPDDRRALDELATCLKQPAIADETVFLVGGADPRGTDAYNKDLGMRRAEAVRAALASRGIDGSRVKVHSRGEKGSSHNPNRYDDARRVDIGITDGGKLSVVEKEVEVTKPGKVIEGEFSERHDEDGDGVDEPGIHAPKPDADKRAGEGFRETGDPDDDGADEPDKSGR